MGTLGVNRCARLYGIFKKTHCRGCQTIVIIDFTPPFSPLRKSIRSFLGASKNPLCVHLWIVLCALCVTNCIL